MLRPGDRFARYRIEKMLGEGGMGLVYRAYDVENDRRVALKIVHANVARASGATTESERDRSLGEAAQRLLREGREAAGFNHPNAVSVIDVGEVSGTPYIAMELVSGRTLRTYVGDRAITMDRRISWLAQIAEGLEAAHLRGLVHRDVKPENVMVCNDGTVKLMDFGGVKKMEEPKKSPSHSSTFVTRAGMVVGTPMYMAPEQAIGENLDGRSDQFAWGTLAYELLSGGIHPIHTNNPKNLPPAFAVIQRHPKPFGEVAPEVPEDVRNIVTRAMKKSRDERYETMGEIASSLRRYLKLKHVKPTSASATDDAASAPTIAITREKPLKKVLEENAKKRQKAAKAGRPVPIVANVNRSNDQGSWAVWILVALIAAMSAYVLSDFMRVMGR